MTTGGRGGRASAVLAATVALSIVLSSCSDPAPTGNRGGLPADTTAPTTDVQRAADLQIAARDVATSDHAPILVEDAAQDSELTDVRHGDPQPPADTAQASDAVDAMDGAAEDTKPLISKLGPPYPIILAHGFFGTDTFAGLKFATYFYGVKSDLNKAGEPLVFTPAVDPFNSTPQRGKALLARIKAVLAQTGHAKVNIIGHSQGGLDARYVASVAPELVSSVVTIATPHRGTPLADIVLKLVPYPAVQAVIDALVKVIGKPIFDKAGQSSSVFAALKQLSPAQAKIFNATYPNNKNIAYFSVAGRSDHTLGLGSCTPDEAHDFVLKMKFATDPIDPLLLLTEAALDGTLFNVKANDGLVRVNDAKWGTFLGCVPADHLDEVGQLLGDKAGLLNPFDHKKMYRWLVKMLRLKGH